MLRILLPCLYLFSTFSAKAQSLDSKATDAYLISRMVEKFHVQPRPLDKTMSAAIYGRMLLALDDQRIFFTREDIAQLSVYRYKLDEEIAGRRTGFLQLVTTLYQHRLMQVDTMVDHMTARPFTFSGSEKLTVMEDSSYPADQAALRTKLYKLIKLSVAMRLADRIIAAGGNTDQKLIDSLEPKLRKKAAVSVKRMIRRLLQSPTGIGNMIGIVYCQALAECYDPHTAYFSPDEKADFESLRVKKQIDLHWLFEFYNAYPDNKKFFDASQSNQIGNFDKLAGTSMLRKQIIAGASEEVIRQSWEPALSRFKRKRKKYLIYPE